jgi:hypothetical protein
MKFVVIDSKTGKLVKGANHQVRVFLKRESADALQDSLIKRAKKGKKNRRWRVILQPPSAEALAAHQKVVEKMLKSTAPTHKLAAAA